MSDLFHPDVPDDYVVAATRVMMAADWHTYQVLTKRAERQRKLLNSKLSFVSNAKHIWWGVSAEDRKYGVPRISEIQQAQVPMRFLSIELLLEDLGLLDLSGMHWAIVGGESGPGARPMSLEWVERIHQQCKDAGVAFFFKQWGGVHKKKNGRLLGGRTFDEFPEYRRNPEPNKSRIGQIVRDTLGLAEVCSFVHDPAPEISI